MMDEYEQGNRWRAAWLALANKREPNRLQAKQDRIEHRAFLANGRVGRAMRARDAQKLNDANEGQRLRANAPEVSSAIKTILSTLPQGAELRFYWQDGFQHFSIKLPGQPVEVARLNRATNGPGVIVPASLH